MGIALADTIRTIRATAILTAFDAGSGPAVMYFYTVPQPAKGAEITSQTLLGSVTFSDPAGVLADCVLTMSPIADDILADNDGVITWARILDGDGVFVADLTVTNNTGAGPIKMASTQVYAGGIIRVTAAVLTEGNA
jgi:hypothetical protein